MSVSELENKDFWKNAFSVLKEDGSLDLQLTTPVNEEAVASFLKMNGFSSIALNSGLIQGSKPKWQA